MRFLCQFNCRFNRLPLSHCGREMRQVSRAIEQISKIVFITHLKEKSINKKLMAFYLVSNHGKRSRFAICLLANQIGKQLEIMSNYLSAC